MIYRRGWVPVLYRSQLEARLKEQGFENWKDISNFLCEGDSTQRHEINSNPDDYCYQVVDNDSWQGMTDATFTQRINRIWFIPLWLLTIPFQWLFRGKIGFESTSKIASIFQKITGLK